MKVLLIMLTLVALVSCDKGVNTPPSNLNISTKKGLNSSGHGVVDSVILFRAELDADFSRTKHVMFYLDGVHRHTEYLIPFGWYWTPRAPGDYIININEVSKTEKVTITKIKLHVVGK